MRETFTRRIPVLALPRDADGKVRFAAPPGLEIVGISYNGIGLIRDGGLFYPFGDPAPNSYHLDEALLPTDGAEHDLTITFERPNPAYPSCFISYSSKDDAFAQQLHSDLQNKGIQCWFAPHDLPIGARTRDEIDIAIRVRDKLLVILSEKSIDSDWVEEEVEIALEKERNTDHRRTVLFPIRIDNAVLETKRPWARKLRRERNIGAFLRWRDSDAYQKSLQRLLRDLAVDQAPKA